MGRSRIVVLLVLWAVSGTAYGQGSDPDGLLGAMEDAYERLDYATAELRAREALANLDRLSADQIVRAHTTLGLLLHTRGEPLEARTHFTAALSLDPNLSLDPVLVSPKTLDFFETVRAERASAAPAAGEPTVRYIRVRDPRPAATLRSLAVPGWGQLYKGEQTKGWALIGTWGALAVGTAAAHVVRGQARQDYLDATVPSEVAERYDTFNAWHRARGALGIGTIVVWTYAAFDALLFEGSRPDALSLTTSEGGARVALRIRL